MSFNDSGHWYDGEGNPCHTQKCGPKAKNPTRPTTIRDARKLGLFPSVTGILGVLAKPQLERWKFRQITDYAVAHPPAPDGSEDPGMFFDRAVEGAFQQVQDAADCGSLIHAALEDFSNGKEVDWNSQILLPELGEERTLKEVAGPAAEFLDEHVQRIIAVEKRLVNKRHGFAGMADLLCELKNGRLACIDFKTRRTDPRYPCTPYDGQPMQIAAYATTAFWEDLEYTGRELAGCNLYISTTEPGRIEACWYDDRRIHEEFEAFAHVVKVWQHIKQYDPSQPTDYTAEDAKADGIPVEEGEL